MYTKTLKLKFWCPHFWTNERLDKSISFKKFDKNKRCNKKLKLTFPFQNRTHKYIFWVLEKLTVAGNKSSKLLICNRLNVSKHYSKIIAKLKFHKIFYCVFLNLMLPIIFARILSRTLTFIPNFVSFFFSLKRISLRNKIYYRIPFDILFQADILAF